MEPLGSAVVTGAARGIGRAVADQLIRRGYHVVVTDLEGAGIRRTADEIGAVAGMAHDVRDEGAHRRVAQEAQRHGRLRVWVNNAGVCHDGNLADLGPEQLRETVEVNLLGAAWGTLAALAAFDRDGGDVVNVASLSAFGPVPGLSGYAATKAAVLSLSTSVAAETPRRVRVHCLCPDGADTAMVAGMDPRGTGKALVHSGGGLLSVDAVAAEVVGMVGRRRVVRALPPWRGVLTRVSGMVPTVAIGALPLFRLLGRRAIRRARSACP